MHDTVLGTVMFAELMDLGMAVVACGNTVFRSGGLNLVVFDFAVFEAFFLVPGLQESAPAAAAEIVGAVGNHIDEIFFSNHRPDHIAKIFGHGIAKALSNDLAGILYGKLDFQVLVPVGIHLELAFADPLGIVFIDAFDFKIVFDVEFFQSGPD